MILFSDKQNKNVQMNSFFNRQNLKQGERGMDGFRGMTFCVSQKYLAKAYSLLKQREGSQYNGKKKAEENFTCMREKQKKNKTIHRVDILGNYI